MRIKSIIILSLISFISFAQDSLQKTIEDITGAVNTITKSMPDEWNTGTIIAFSIGAILVSIPIIIKVVKRHKK